MSVHELPVVPEVDRDAFRNAMARLGSAVNIITTDGPAGCPLMPRCAAQSH